VPFSSKFYELHTVVKVSDDLRPAGLEALEHDAVGNIAGTNPNHTDGSAPAAVDRNKIAILRYEYRAGAARILANCRIVGVVQSNIPYVFRGITHLAQPIGKRQWQLSIDEELHSAAVTTGWFISRAA